MKCDGVNPHYQPANDVSIIPSHCSISGLRDGDTLVCGASVNGEFILDLTRYNTCICKRTCVCVCVREFHREPFERLLGHLPTVLSLCLLFLLVGG